MMKTRVRPINVFCTAFLTLGLFCVFLPFFLVIINSFKTAAESAHGFFALPASLNLENYKTVIFDENFPLYFFNTVEILVLSMGGILLILPLTSWLVAKNMHRIYYKTFYILLIIGILVPFQVIMSPMTMWMTKLGLMNKLGLILLYITFSMTQGVFLYTSYIRSVIPKELEEAAMIDGSGVLATYWKIIFPLLMPMTGTVIIMNSLWIWNDFLMPLLILNLSDKNWTLTLFQYNFRTQYSTDYNLVFVTVLLSAIPIVVIYAFFQKYIIAGLTGGAIKS